MLRHHRLAVGAFLMPGFFKKYRAEKEAAEKAHTRAELHAAITGLIPIVEGGSRESDSSLVLHRGERLVYGITNGGLFEPRRGPGHWSGRSGGFSVPVTDGIRFRIGKSAGTYVQGAENPTVIDKGDISFTTQRVVFRGGKYTREWLFSKLIGVTHDVHEPWTAIQVSNRDKTSGITYAGLAPEVVRLSLAVAIGIFNGESQEVAKELRDELAAVNGDPTDAALKVAPAGVASDAPRSPQPTSDSQVASSSSSVASTAPSNPPSLASVPPPPAAIWASDPSGRHQYRWWDGTTWTAYVADNGKESQDPLAAGPT
jgi:hypothetical protein